MNPLILSVAVAAALSATAGWKVTSWYYQSEISSMKLEAAELATEAQDRKNKIELMALELAGAVSARDAARRQQIRTVERVVTREVIKYVQNPDIERVYLPPEWVRIHNTAAGGGVPEDTGAPGATDDPTVGVTDADAIAVVAENYGICTDNRAQLIALQEWAAGVGKLNPNPL
jgi:hypothetical protein